MPDDWSWFWAGEKGRDNLLRDEIAGLQRDASASSAQSEQLSSQLRTLQGSIEIRLQALSTAFDAYVELGDVREQLAGFPGTGAVRRDAVRALAVLARGGAAQPVDGRGTGYWLVDAVNEVVALTSGTPGGVPSAASVRGPEHETFVVAALGWLGQGDRVVGRVAPLLVGDGTLAPPQVVLWQAVVHGCYGPDAVETVRDAWRHDLDLAAPTWDGFVTGAAPAPGPVGRLRWVHELVAGSWDPARGEGDRWADDRPGLRALVDALLGTGVGDERALLERARVLRTRIEDPGAPYRSPSTEPTEPSTTRLVQRALLDPDVPPATRRRLTDWVRPGLQAAAAAIASEVAARRPAPTVVSTELGDVEVGTDGAAPGRLAQLDALAAERWANPRARWAVPAVVTGAALVTGVVLLVSDVGALGVCVLLVAVVAGVVLARALLRARGSTRELADARGRVRARVEEGRVRAVSAGSAALETRAEVAGLARAVADAGTSSSPAPR